MRANVNTGDEFCEVLVGLCLPNSGNPVHPDEDDWKWNDRVICCQFENEAECEAEYGGAFGNFFSLFEADSAISLGMSVASLAFGI